MSAVHEVEIPLLGITVTPMTADDVCRNLATPAAQPTVILGHNLHSCYVAQVDPEFSRLYEISDVRLIDGAPVLAMAALRQRKLRWAERVSSTDWLNLIFSGDSGLRDARVFVVGGSGDVNRRLVDLLDACPATAAADGISGYFDQYEDWASEALAAISTFRPTIVLIGMGMPLQEHFLIENLDLLPPAHYACVGGALDFLTGNKILAPEPIRKAGLEWLWRLAHEPTRLAGRYLVEPFKLAAVLLRNRGNRQRARL